MSATGSGAGFQIIVGANNLTRLVKVNAKIWRAKH